MIYPFLLFIFLAQEIQTPTQTLYVVLSVAGGAVGVIIGALATYIVKLLTDRGKVNDAKTEVEVGIEEAKKEAIKREDKLQDFVVQMAEQLQHSQKQMTEDMKQLVADQRLAEAKVANLTGQAEAAIKRADSADSRLADAIKQIGAAEATNKAQAKELDSLRDARRAQEGVNTVQATRIHELTENLARTLELQNEVIKNRDLAMAERDNAVKEVAQLRATVAQLEDKNTEQTAKITYLEKRVGELETEISALRNREAHLEKKVTATLPALPASGL